MKQKDIVLIVVVIFVSAIISLFASKAIFASPKDRKQSVEVVQQITSEFPETDSKYFNKDAFDPTKPITIQQNENNDPFSGTSQ